jgi:hypothetical protein
LKIVINFVAQSTFTDMEKQTEDIRVIREMMERSTKFLSLNGMSGIVAGIAALAGAAFAWLHLLNDPGATGYNRFQEAMILLADAVAVLAVSLGAGLWLAGRKARRSGQKLLNHVTYRILYALAVPLVAGGVFCLTYMLRGDVRMVISATLIFYGVALVAASKYTYGEIHYLGLTEIVLGLAAAMFDRSGIVFWALGFGVCHIVYGLVMYLKYDKKSDGRIDLRSE